MVVGSSHPLTGRRKPHNCLYVISSRGKLVERYDKRFCTGNRTCKVQDLALAADFAITSIRPLAPEKQTGYTTLPLYVDATGTIQQLSKFLSLLDSSYEFIAIDKLQISNAPFETLRVRVQLSGLMKS